MDKPTTLEGIRKLARKIHREEGLQEHRAKDKAATIAGYSCYGTAWLAMKEKPQKDKRILAVAQAIEGPHTGKFIDREHLQRLRDIKWGNLSDQDRAVRLMEARAAIKQWDSASFLAMGTEHVDEEQSG